MEDDIKHGDKDFFIQKFAERGKFTVNVVTMVVGL